MRASLRLPPSPPPAGASLGGGIGLLPACQRMAVSFTSWPVQLHPDNAE
jgi:hypothetical protein